MKDTVSKKCRKCDLTKPVELFNKKLRGITSWCKECLSVSEKERRCSKRVIAIITDLPDENWYPMAGYENLYEVSDKNRVKGLPKHIKRKDGFTSELFPILRKIHKTQDGYWTVRVSKNNKAKSILIHIAIAKATKPNPLNLPEVNHIDANKENNHPTNLEWCTHKRNMEHAAELKLITYRRGSETHCSSITEETAKLIFISKLSGIETAKKYNVTPQIVSCIKTGKTWNHVTGLKCTRKTYTK